MDEIIEKLFDKKLAGITWLTELNVGKLFHFNKPFPFRIYNLYIEQNLCYYLQIEIQTWVVMMIMMIKINDTDEL